MTAATIAVWTLIAVAALYLGGSAAILVWHAQQCTDVEVCAP